MWLSCHEQHVRFHCPLNAYREGGLLDLHDFSYQFFCHNFFTVESAVYKIDWRLFCLFKWRCLVTVMGEKMTDDLDHYLLLSLSLCLSRSIRGVYFVKFNQQEHCNWPSFILNSDYESAFYLRLLLPCSNVVCKFY